MSANDGRTDNDSPLGINAKIDGQPARLVEGPSLTPVARLYNSNGYRRASVLDGPGEPLVLLSDAAQWRQKAVTRGAGIEQYIQERDRLQSDLSASRAECERYREALRHVRQYGSDTLSGRVDGPDDRKWQRDAVLFMTRLARQALEAK